MNRLFYIIGKSSTGKDTIYKELCGKMYLHLKPLIMYTTRPIRINEENGREYFFVEEKELQKLEETGKVIEKREYHTVQGLWTYFTVDDRNTDLENQDYIAIGTLESYQKIRDYYGREKVIPLYVEVEDGLRLERALKREKMQKKPGYEELCRRFLADQADYSEEKLKEADMKNRFSNDTDIESCVNKMAEFIQTYQQMRESGESGSEGRGHGRI